MCDCSVICVCLDKADLLIFDRIRKRIDTTAIKEPFCRLDFYLYAAAFHQGIRVDARLKHLNYNSVIRFECRIYSEPQLK